VFLSFVLPTLAVRGSVSQKAHRSDRLLALWPLTCMGQLFASLCRPTYGSQHV